MNPLIYGNKPDSRIVGIEINDNLAELFIEDKIGNISSKFVPNKYWLLSNEQLNADWKRLQGDLHYKWGKSYETRDEYLAARSHWKYKRNRDIYGVYAEKESFLIRFGYTYFKEMSHTEPSILSFDLETNGLKKDDNSRIFLISNTFRKAGVIEKKLFSFDQFDPDLDKAQPLMLAAWCQWVREKNPSIITGHNIILYDLPFADHVANLFGSGLKLGRNGSELRFNDRTSYFRKDQTQGLDYYRPNIYGREVVDTYFLAIKADMAVKKYDSYGLKPIIKAEGLEKPGRTFYEASKIRSNWNNPGEWEKIKRYACDDSDDSLALYDLFIPPFFYTAQSVPKPLQDIVAGATGSQLNAVMVRSYLQDTHSIPKADEAVDYEGAISQGTPGIWKNILKADIASLYPNIMLSFKIFNRAKDPKEHMLKILDYYTTERLKNKQLAKDTGNKYYKHLENSQKISINSIYGFLGTNGVNFNDPKSAALVTKYGREILIKAMQWAKDKEFHLTSVDTDSIAFCKKDQSPISDEEQYQLIDELNILFPERIKFMHDGYFTHGIVFKAKNYLLYDGESIKYKGSSLKSATLELALRQFIDDIVHSILNDRTDYLDIYNRYVKEIMTGIKDIYQWSSKKTLTDKTYSSERANETKVKDAVEGTEYVQGDKIRVYFTLTGDLKLAEKYDPNNPDYDKMKFLEKLYKVTERFDDIIDTSVFLNYKLKKNQAVLQNLYL